MPLFLERVSSPHFYRRAWRCSWSLKLNTSEQLWLSKEEKVLLCCSGQGAGSFSHVSQAGRLAPQGIPGTRCWVAGCMWSSSFTHWHFPGLQSSFFSHLLHSTLRNPTSYQQRKKNHSGRIKNHIPERHSSWEPSTWWTPHGVHLTTLPKCCLQTGENTSVPVTGWVLAENNDVFTLQ